MVAKALLQGRSVLVTKLLQPNARADVEQLRGQATSSFRQSRTVDAVASSRTLETLATDGTNIGVDAARPFEEMPQPKK